MTPAIRTSARRKASTPSMKQEPITTTQHPKTDHRLHPTTILFAIYPLTLGLGSLYSFLTPTPPYDPITQAHHPAPSYFARKNNLLNVYFVKILWFWVTLSFTLLVLPLLRKGDAPRLARAALRYALATAAWVLVTQWAFGPALIDRTFAASGGLCAIAAQKDIEAALASDGATASVKKLEGVVTGAGCRAVGGTWAGGHDISGHVFLLMLGSGLLVLEALPAAARAKSWDLGTRVAAGMAGLCWWMLLMTATYFHTWFEKLTGCAVAMAALGTIYVLPLQVPAVRQVLGRPGE